MKMLRSLFDVYWRQLAAEGKVDAIDSAEYTRVLGEWRVKGYPDVTPEWMVERVTPGADRFAVDRNAFAIDPAITEILVWVPES